MRKLVSILLAGLVVTPAPAHRDQEAKRLAVKEGL